MYHFKKQFIFICACLVGMSAYAQDIVSSTQGFFLNLNGQFTSWSSESQYFGEIDDLSDGGLGISIRAGYGITQNIEVFAEYGVAGISSDFSFDTYRISNFHIGGRYNFGATLRAVRPFLEASLSNQSLTIDPITFDQVVFFESESSGWGGAVGGGLHYFFLQNLSVSGLFRADFGNFGNTSLSGRDVTDLNEDLDYTIISIQFGLNYYFE
ncbi:MAG: outer membrane beta-barrel protein [Bacteroidota bacterium]